MPKSGKKLVEGMVKVEPMGGDNWRIVVQPGHVRFFVGQWGSWDAAAGELKLTLRMLAAVVNAALKEVGKCQK